MGPIGKPAKTVSKDLKPRNNPKDGRIQFNEDGSLQSRTISLLISYFVNNNQKNAKRNTSPPVYWSATAEGYR
jgi:hypothetical protein